MDWSGVDHLWIIVMFLSVVWTLILTAPIHYRGSIGEQVMWCYISPNLFWWRNKLIYILDDLRVRTFSANFHFWVNYCFKYKLLHYKNITTEIVKLKKNSPLKIITVSRAEVILAEWDIRWAKTAELEVNQTTGSVEYLRGRLAYNSISVLQRLKHDDKARERRDRRRER